MNYRYALAAFVASGLAVAFVNSHLAGAQSGHAHSSAHQLATKESAMQPAQASSIALLPVGQSTGALTQTFDIQVRNASGQPVERFATSHEKLMHLIVVSDDLRHYRHLHPEYRGNGTFRIPVHFPAAGRYTFFADYLPVGGSQQISVEKFVAGAPGRPGRPAGPDGVLRKSVDSVTAQLSPSAGSIRPGEPVTLHFDLSDAAGRPLTDLQPYLGAMGHLVALQYSPQLGTEHYLHAHPEQLAAGHTEHGHGHGHPTPGRVSFHTVFPKPGLYKLWGEFQRGGRVFAVDFTLSIAG